MHRRNTIRLLLAGSLASLAGPVLYVVGRYLKPPKRAPATATVAPDASFPPNSTQLLRVGETEAIVMRDASGKLTAFNLRCTHAACTVGWNASSRTFACPCHGGAFAADGSVTAGPPPRPLEQLPVQISDGVIMVSERGGSAG